MVQFVTTLLETQLQVTQDVDGQRFCVGMMQTRQQATFEKEPREYTRGVILFRYARQHGCIYDFVVMI